MQNGSSFAGQPGRPVLVGACPRSGTTLLRTMLDNHPELAMPRETRFVIEAWDRRRAFGDLRDVANRRRLAHWIFDRKETWRGRLELDHEQAVERLAAAPPTLGSLVATPFVMYAERHGKPRWGDKRPTYATRMEVVWGLFPNAQFINVVRDPRSCAASMRRLEWYEGRISPAVELWERSIRSADSWRGELSVDQLLDVRFEDLVADPEGELTRIAAFAGLAADDDAVESMLRYHERREERSDRYHANVSSPPDRTRVSAWSDVLSPEEVAFVEAETGRLMLRYGYEPTAGGVSPPAELVREHRRRRRRQQARRLRSSSKDRIRRLVLYRHPLAAVPVEDQATANPGVPTR